MLGGAYYYDMQGTPIGVYGDSSEIRIVDRSVFIASLGAALGSMDLNYALNNLIGSSVFYHANSEQRGNVIRSIASQAGVNSSYLSMVNQSEGFYGGYLNDQIYININLRLMEYGNYNDFYCLLKHEQYHMNNNVPNDTNYNEYIAYYYVNNEVDEFKYASDSYRQHSEDNEQYFGSLL